MKRWKLSPLSPASLDFVLKSSFITGDNSFETGDKPSNFGDKVLKSGDILRSPELSDLFLLCWKKERKWVYQMN
jgi:hypothetical protein